MGLAALHHIQCRPNTQDAVVANEVLGHDVYGVAGLHLSPRDIVLDIGAHIGTFSMACLRKEPSLVLAAFEPDKDNVRICRANLAQWSGNAACFRAAVWRSDRDGEIPFHGYEGRFTGSGTAMPQMAQQGSPKTTVTTLGLDELLQMFGATRVRLIKIDAEGAEYPILLTSKRLAQVDEIIGEAHRIGAVKEAIAGRQNLTMDVLAGYLRSEGFDDVETREKYQSETIEGAINTYLTFFRARRTSCQ